MVSAGSFINNIQWNLYKADTIGAWKKCPLYGDVRFIEIPPENKYLAQIKRKIGVCYGFLSLCSRWVEERTHLMKQCLFISITQEYKEYSPVQVHWN